MTQKKKIFEMLGTFFILCTYMNLGKLKLSGPHNNPVNTAMVRGGQDEDKETLPMALTYKVSK